MPRTLCGCRRSTRWCICTDGTYGLAAFDIETIPALRGQPGGGLQKEREKNTSGIPPMDGRAVMHKKQPPPLDHTQHLPRNQLPPRPPVPQPHPCHLPCCHLLRTSRAAQGQGKNGGHAHTSVRCGLVSSKPHHVGSSQQQKKNERKTKYGIVYR